MADNTCKVTWNPGTWPYTTKCVLDQGHQADHEDREGRTLRQRAEEVLEEVRAEDIDHLYCGHCGGINEVQRIDLIEQVRYLCIVCRSKILRWI